MPEKEHVSIAPAEGKLGVLIPGMGAVTTTFIAGVEAIKRKLAKPIGSVTQMATIRLGKRTEGRSPRIQDFVPLASLEDLVFGTWDIYPDTCYEAAEKAGVLEKSLLEKLKEPLSAIRPMPAVFDHDFVRRIDGPNKKAAGIQDGPCRDADGRHPQFPRVHRRRPAGDDLVRFHGSLPPARRRAPDPGRFRMRPAEERPGDFAQPDLRLCRAEDGRALRQWRAASDYG